jgi:hypothetical protein
MSEEKKEKGSNRQPREGMRRKARALNEPKRSRVVKNMWKGSSGNGSLKSFVMSIVGFNESAKSWLDAKRAEKK